MGDFIKMLSILFVVCGLAAGSLAVVNAVTKERIASSEERRRDAALREVCPDADELKNVAPDRVWEALRKGERVGYVFLSHVQGYSGPITLVFGTNSDGTLRGLEVLSHTETPGLGAKIGTAQFRDQFRNKRPEQLLLRKDDPGKGQIDAITGATISSRAVTEAVRSTLASSNQEQGGGVSYEERRRDAALREVCPDADEFRNVAPDRAWEALRKGERVGYAFLSQVQGEDGPITLVFGTDADGAVTGVQIVSHTETPGLGAKIAEAQFRDQFKNKRAEQLLLRKDDPGKGQIDAITGATISSRAVTEAVRSTLESFNREQGGGAK
jgi:electron transport complex protein RnfG